MLYLIMQNIAYIVDRIWHQWYGTTPEEEIWLHWILLWLDCDRRYIKTRSAKKIKFVTPRQDLRLNPIIKTAKSIKI